MAQIWKYQAPLGDYLAACPWPPLSGAPLARKWLFELEMPEGAVILSAHEQRGEIAIWACVDPSRPPAVRRLSMLPTGSGNFEIEGRFLGTAVLRENGRDGGLVVHLFEECE